MLFFSIIKEVKNKKIMALTISCILTPLFAAQLLVPDLVQITNKTQPLQLHPETVEPVQSLP